MAKKKTRRASLRVEELESREMLTSSPLHPAGALLLQGFDHTAAQALPSGWSQWSNQDAFAVNGHEALSGHNSLTVTGAPGQVSRAWVNTTLTANEQASAAIFVDSLSPGQVLVRGQHLDTTSPTYYAVSLTRGLAAELVRVVDGHSKVLGHVHSKDYVNNRWIQVTLTADGSALKVRIYRTDLREYLDSHGIWQRRATDALDRTDGTIRGGGLVGLAEPSTHAGTVTFDNFQATGVTAGAHGKNVVLQQRFDGTKPGTLPAGWSQWSNQGDFSVTANGGLNSRQGIASTGVTGEAARSWTNQSFAADIQASAAIFASSLIPAQVFLRGSNLDTARPTFYAVSVTRGLDVQLVRLVNGVSSVLGQVRSLDYLNARWVVATISATGSTLRAQIYRPDTRQYLNSKGRWQSTATWVLTRTDLKITHGGHAGLARPASYAGVVHFDDFSVSHAGTAAPTHAPTTRPAVRPAVRPSVHVPAPASRKDRTPPAVRITTPRSGSIVNQLAILNATASDNTGITHVDFYFDGKLVASDLNAPYDWVLDPSVIHDGVHHVTVKAYDRAGNVGQVSEYLTIRKPTHKPPPSIDIPRHYSHIRIAELAYSGTPLDAALRQLLKNSVDLVIPNPDYLNSIHSLAPHTPQLIYTNVSSLYTTLLSDWLNYADAHHVSREDAFYHVTHATHFSGTSNSSQPVNWFWGVYLGGDTPSFTDLTLAAHSTQPVQFGSNGEAIYLGYTDKFREINFRLQSGAHNGWSSVLEYATAVDGNGNPTNWATLRTVTDTTAGLAHSGRITFDPPPNWATASLNGTNRLFYVRIRTVSDGTAPVTRTILGRDYVNANGHASGTVPAFDKSVDLNHDGYLNDAEYAHRHRGMDARFVYESRDFTNYGQQRPPTNPADAAFRAWAIDYNTRVLKSHPLAAGLFMDNSSGKQPVDDGDVAESLATYSRDYGALLNQLGKAIAPHWILANTAGGQINSDGVVAQNTSYFEEFALRPLASDYVAFEDLAAQVAHRISLNPKGFAVLDSLPTGGSPTDRRTQIATLAYYYLLADPVHTFLDFYGGYAPATSWSQHWVKAAAFNVGQPVGTWSLFATGHDPANRSLTYRVYQRAYTNALVLYKPLSHATGKSTRASLGPASATTFNLNGKYRQLRADGTLGTVVTRVTLRNGDGAILVKA